MLLQSHEANTLRLLPALPPAWTDGQVTGLRARGGITVDIYWRDGQLERAVLHPTVDGQVRLRFRDQETAVSLKGQERFVYRP